MKNIFSLKSILTLLLVSILIFSFTSCSTRKNDTAFLDQISAAEEYSDEVVSKDDSSEPPTQEGYTSRPIVTHIINSDPYSVIVAGTCEEGSVIKAYNVAQEEEKYETKSIGKYFIFEVTLKNTNEQYFEISATVEGKNESTVNYFTAKYNAVAEKPANGTAISIGNNSTMFYDSLINLYKGENLLTNTEIKAFKDSIATKTDKNGIKYVYVMLPSVLSAYDEIIPDAIKQDKVSYNTKLDQLANALSGLNNIDVINMKDVFNANKNGEQPIYYNTSSNLSDFGAYLTYQEIVKYLGAEALEYKFNKTQGVGGDMISNLGLDAEIFTENYFYAEKNFVTTIPEEIEGTCKVNDVVVYSDKNSNTYNSAIAEDEVFGANERLNFKTNRPTLPSAVFLRDNASNAMVSMLVEHFNNSYFEANNNFDMTTTEINSAISEYANEDKAYVDYVFVIVSENNINSIIG